MMQVNLAYMTISPMSNCLGLKWGHGLLT